MFYSLTGKVVAIEDTAVALQCGGIAFRCMTTLNTISKIGRTGEEATLFTHLNVREDAMDLFGFYTQQELDCFKQLISVSGVGPKAALAILSQLSFMLPHRGVSSRRLGREGWAALTARFSGPTGA